MKGFEAPNKLNRLPSVEDDNTKEDSLEESSLSVGGIKSEKEDNKETNKEHLTDYPDYLYERIDERSKENGGSEALTDLSAFSRGEANRIEEDRNSINNLENEGNEKIMLAHHIREAINTEIGLIKKSPEKRLEGINLLIKHVEKMTPREMNLEVLNSNLSKEERNNVESTIVYHNSMIKFLNDRKEGIQRNLK